MLTEQIVAAVIVFIVYIVLKRTQPILADAGVFLLFLWGITIFDYSILQLIFYPVALLFSMIMEMRTQFQANSSQADLNGKAKGGIIRGWGHTLFTIGLGVVMIFVISTMTAAKGQIIGYSALATSAIEFKSVITVMMAAAISGAVGIIENKLIFGVMQALVNSADYYIGILTGAMNAIVALLMSIPAAGPFLAMIFGSVISLIIGTAWLFPYFMAAFIFGFFHVVAYKILWSLMIWAASIMLMWIVSYYITGHDTTAANTCHYGWNAYVTSKSAVSLSIVQPPIIGG